MLYRNETTWGGREFAFEVGKLAQQADGAVVARYGDTMVLATAVASKEPREGVDFFPLTVDFEEKLYAAGRIPGNWFRREGRPGEEGILTARLIDRPLRPLFPKGFRNDVQVIVTVLSADREIYPDVVGINGASAALMISGIPFGGPVGACRVGYIDEQFVVNPTASQFLESKINLAIACTADAVMMVECGANELSESLVLEAIKFGQREVQEIIRMQEKLVQVMGKPVREVPLHVVSADLKARLTAAMETRAAEAFDQPEKLARENALSEMETAAVAEFAGEAEPGIIKEVFADMIKTRVRDNIINKEIRPDGRGLTTIRPISCEVGMLPRPHGSGLFTRGQTQVLSVVTLGSSGNEQTIENLGIAESKRFLHHYNFPPYSTGEARPLRGTGRREIGHGALVARAIEPMLPSKEEFPYTIRVVSEVLASNGSSSMASVCGSSMGLMDAGVPLRKAVAGVAMGLVKGEEGRYAILTDIQGMEDALGDMDFKVAGTRDGITALQMDIKVKGITFEIMEKALAQATAGRLFILDRMETAISEPRAEMSPYAPRIFTIHINPEKIGSVIGPGGKTIRALEEETGVDIDIEDDGTIFVAAVDGVGAEKALQRIRAITEEPEVGKTYLAKVKRIVDFGVFVEILPGKEGLVRLGQLSDGPVERPEDVVKLGDEIEVKLIEVDSMGRLNLSRRAVLTGSTVGEGSNSGGPPRGGGGGRPPFGRPGGGPPRGGFGPRPPRF